MVSQDQFAPQFWSEIYTQIYFKSSLFIIYAELGWLFFSATQRNRKDPFHLRDALRSLLWDTYGFEITKEEDRAAARQSRRGLLDLMSDLKEQFINYQLTLSTAQD